MPQVQDQSNFLTCSPDTTTMLRLPQFGLWNEIEKMTEAKWKDFLVLAKILGIQGEQETGNTVLYGVLQTSKSGKIKDPGQYSR